MILGSGYVGLVSGCCFAEFGFEVICVDVDPSKIKQLQQGVLPIYEPELPMLLSKNLAAKRISFTTDLYAEINNVDLILLAIGTTNIPNTAKVDLSAMLSAVRSLALHLKKYTPIVIKSTVPPGTGDMLRQEILNINSHAKFDMVSNPEFLREGTAVNDFMRPDRIIIGLDNPATRKIMTKLYYPFHSQQIPLIFTNLKSAELIKYAANAFLATKIAFINEIADICEAIDANVQVISHAMGLDHRIGEQFLQPGPGFGGSCLPKDSLVLNQFANNVDRPSKIIASVIAANESRKNACVIKVISACNGSVNGKNIAILGLAFKANTDDIRESPALTLISCLLAAGAIITAYDPVAINNTKNHFGPQPNLKYAANIKQCISGAHALVLITDWSEFRSLKANDLHMMLRPYDEQSPAVFVDLRNLYSLDHFKDLNIRYVSIGRPSCQSELYNEHQ